MTPVSQRSLTSYSPVIQVTPSAIAWDVRHAGACTLKLYIMVEEGKKMYLWDAVDRKGREAREKMGIIYLSTYNYLLYWRSSLLSR